MDYLLSQQLQDTQPVVVNLSTSYIVADIAKKYGRNVIYTRIGETHVTKGIKQFQAPVGGEGNGGVIYPAVGWGRDSLVGMVSALAFLAESKRTVSEIISTYPHYILVREKIALQDPKDVQQFLSKMKEKFKQYPIDTQDGVKVMLDQAWLHVRASNTEPIIRFFAEAKTEQEARTLIEKAQF
jgi:phosphomannomutase